MFCRLFCKLPSGFALKILVISKHSKFNFFAARNMSNLVKTTLPKYAAGTQPYTVLVEGNIASGKTLFLDNFKHLEDEICIMTEPVEKWRNLGGNNLLELMYKEPQRWAIPFQAYVTLTLLRNHTSQTDKRIKLMERSIYSSRYCFVNNMLKNGAIEEGMFQVLQEWYRFIDDAIHIQADLIVYLRTTPEIVYERMKKRARSEETCVPLEYLRELHELHEDWLIHRKVGDNTKVLVLDATVDLSNITEEYKRFENVIKPFTPTGPDKPAMDVKCAQSG